MTFNKKNVFKYKSTKHIQFSNCVKNMFIVRPFENVNKNAVCFIIIFIVTLLSQYVKFNYVKKKLQNFTTLKKLFLSVKKCFKRIKQISRLMVENKESLFFINIYLIVVIFNKNSI